jgi:hypothetical protein
MQKCVTGLLIKKNNNNKKQEKKTALMLLEIFRIEYLASFEINLGDIWNVAFGHFLILSSICGRVGLSITTQTPTKDLPSTVKISSLASLLEKS